MTEQEPLGHVDHGGARHQQPAHEQHGAPPRCGRHPTRHLHASDLRGRARHRARGCRVALGRTQRLHFSNAGGTPSVHARRRHARRRRSGDPAPDTSAPQIIDFSNLLAALLDGIERGDDPGMLARMAHDAVARTIARAAATIAQREGLSHVALSGGCFMNRLLLTLIKRNLEANGLTVLAPRETPVNDRLHRLRPGRHRPSPPRPVTPACLPAPGRVHGCSNATGAGTIHPSPTAAPKPHAEASAALQKRRSYVPRRSRQDSRDAR